MKAIEFEAEIKNGVIAIPDEYPEFNRGRVKVIVLQDEKEMARRELAKAIEEANRTAAQYPELSEMTMEEITAIVKKFAVEKNKVVLDTNVFISSLISQPQSYPFRLVHGCLALESRAIVCLSEDIWAEYRRVVQYAKFSRYPDFVARAQHALAVLEKSGEYVVPNVKLSVIADEPDNRFLELAVAAKANFLITGNTQDFTFSHFEGVRIVSPKEFVETHCN